MQHMLLENIEWDTDGMRPVEDCNLPLNVLAINVPAGGPGGMSEDDLEEYLGELLSETYGFLHYGFTLRGINLDGSRAEGGYRSAKPWRDVCDAIMDAEAPASVNPRFIRFEFDREYSGGDYSKTGDFAYVPVETVEAYGPEAGFMKHTGIDPVHIIHYSPDELYDRAGNHVEE